MQILSDLYGLNFTSATLSAACKYTSKSNEVVNKQERIHEKTKTGFFTSENELVDLIRKETGTGDCRNPISFIVESCDDIVYSVVDLEDGIKKGVISWEYLMEQLKNYPMGKEELLKHCIKKAEMMINKPGSVSLDGKARDEAMSQAFRVYAIGESVKAVIDTFKLQYENVMNGDYHKELIKDSSAAFLIKACKEVGTEHIYCAEPNLKKELMGRNIIHILMGVFWEGVSLHGEQGKRFAGKIFKLMSDNYRQVYEAALKKNVLPEKYCKMQLMTDYICGMTDTFACALHKELTNA